MIEAVIDHQRKSLIMKDQTDVYSSNEPQLVFHKRIKFCQEMYNDAMKALEFPKKDDKRDFGDLDKDKKETDEIDFLQSLLEDFEDM